MLFAAALLLLQHSIGQVLSSRKCRSKNEACEGLGDKSRELASMQPNLIHALQLYFLKMLQLYFLKMSAWEICAWLEDRPTKVALKSTMAGFGEPFALKSGT